MRHLILSFLLAVGVAAGAAPTKPAGKPAPSQAAQTAASDAKIESAIKAKLAKSKIGADGFKIRVQNGIAYWDGTTNVIQHKGAATRMARTAGARSVVNRIQISEAARAKAASKLAGSRRRVEVKRGDERGEPRSR